MLTYLFNSTTILVCVCARVCVCQDEEAEDDEFYTAHNTILQQGGKKKKDGTMITTEDTITNLGTLVIIDDAEDIEEEMDTMKRQQYRSGYSAKNQMLEGEAL